MEGSKDYTHCNQRPPCLLLFPPLKNKTVENKKLKINKKWKVSQVSLSYLSKMYHINFTIRLVYCTGLPYIVCKCTVQLALAG